MWIVVEGVDGAGKSTLINGLKTFFPNNFVIREPGGTPFGDWIRGIVKGHDSLFAPPETSQCIELCEKFQALGLPPMDKDFPRHERSTTETMLLFLLARSELYWSKIYPALSSQKPVVILQDRGMLSTYAYQAHDKHTQALLQNFQDLVWPKKPDLTLLLDLPAEISMQRINQRNIEENQSGQDFFERKGLSYFQAVREKYLQQMNQRDIHSQVIDARQSPEEIQQQAIDMVQSIKAQTK